MKVTQGNLHLVYTPGVAKAAQAIAKNPQNSFIYTSRWNNVAIITDGSRTLGVGDTIPEASLPIMEGKAVLFKVLADINAYPLCLATRSVKEIIRVIEILTPNFKAFNIEDIKSPRYFEIMEGLEKRNILSFYDDHQGAAIVVLAGLMNALKVMKKNIKEVKIFLAGAGVAGLGVFKILKEVGIKKLFISDEQGIIYRWRKGDNKYLREIAKFTNPDNKKGDLRTAIKGVDVFIGLSGVGQLLKSKDVALMAKKPIIFALSNPIPEIFPKEIEKSTQDYLYATGRSDFPNQVNNALVFPGIFLGMLKNQRKVNLKLGIKIAKAIANLIPHPTKKRILPKILDKRLVKTVQDCF